VARGLHEDLVEQESRPLRAVVLHDPVERAEPVERLLVVDVPLRFALGSDVAISFDGLQG
jgi:hypothetical protein